MKTRDYWSFDHIDQLTEKQRKTIKSFHLSDKKIKERTTFRGPKKINPNWYLKISPEEIDRQYKQAMEQMKRDQEAKTARETSLEVEASLSHGR